MTIDPRTLVHIHLIDERERAFYDYDDRFDEMPAGAKPKGRSGKLAYSMMHYRALVISNLGVNESVHPTMIIVGSKKTTWEWANQEKIKD